MVLQNAETGEVISRTTVNRDGVASLALNGFKGKVLAAFSEADMIMEVKSLFIR